MKKDFKTIVLIGDNSDRRLAIKEMKARLMSIGCENKVVFLDQDVVNDIHQHDAVFYLRVATVRGRDREILNAWIGHRHLRIIPALAGNRQRDGLLWKHVCRMLGIPKPLEVERKFLVEGLESPLSVHHNTVRIIQEYLKPEADGSVARIRKVVYDPNSFSGQMMFKTIKRKISNMTREEIECEIDKHSYKLLHREVDPNTEAIIKNRTYFIYKDQYFELDEFVLPYDNLTLLEIELLEENDKVVLPPFVKIIKEVTGDSRYSNSHLARLSLGKHSHLTSYP